MKFAKESLLKSTPHLKRKVIPLFLFSDEGRLCIVYAAWTLPSFKLGTYKRKEHNTARYSSNSNKLPEMNTPESESSGFMEWDSHDHGAELTRLIMTLSTDPLYGISPYTITGNASFHYPSDGDVSSEDMELLCDLASSFEDSLPFEKKQFKTIDDFISENQHFITNQQLLSETVRSRMRSSVIISARIGHYRLHDFEFNKTIADNYSYLVNTDDILQDTPHFYNHAEIGHRHNDWVHFATVDLNHFLTTRNLQLRIERFNLNLAETIGYPSCSIKPIYSPANSYDAYGFSNYPPCQCESRGYFPSDTAFKHFPLCKVSHFSDGNRQSCIIAMCYKEIIAKYSIYPCISDTFLCETCVVCRHGKKFLSCSSLHRYVLSSLRNLPCHNFNQNYDVTHCMCGFSVHSQISRINDYRNPEYKKVKSSQGSSSRKVIQFSFHFSLEAVSLRKYFHLVCLKEGFYTKLMSWSLLFEQQISSILGSNFLPFSNYFVNPQDFQNYLEPLFQEYADTKRCFEYVCTELTNYEKELQEHGQIENYEISQEEYQEFLKMYWKHVKEELFLNRCYDIVHLRKLDVILAGRTPNSLELGQVPHIETLSYLYSLFEFCKSKNPNSKSKVSEISISLALDGLNQKSSNKNSRFMECLGFFQESKRRHLFHKLKTGMSLASESSFSPKTEVIETLVRHLIDEQKNKRIIGLPLLVTHRIYSKVKCNCPDTDF